MTLYTANLSYFKNGVQVPNWQTARAADFQKIKASGADHVAFVVVPDHYPGGGKPPVIPQARLDSLLQATDLAMAKGLRVDWKLNPLDQTAEGVWASKNFAEFSGMDEQIAKAANTCDKKRLRVEIHPEPGIYPQLTNDLKAATDFLEAEWAYRIPKIRAISDVTLLLGTPGFGHFIPGEGEQQFLTANYPNTVRVWRYYCPKPFTDNGSAGWPWRDLTWPMPDWKIAYKGQDINTIDYVNDRQPWDKTGMRFHLNKLVAWRNKTLNKVHLSEMGVLSPMRGTPAGDAYMADLRSLCAELAIPFTLWGQ